MPSTPNKGNVPESETVKVPVVPSKPKSSKVDKEKAPGATPSIPLGGPFDELVRKNFSIVGTDGSICNRLALYGSRVALRLL